MDAEHTEIGDFARHLRFWTFLKGMACDGQLSLIAHALDCTIEDLTAKRVRKVEGSSAVLEYRRNRVQFMKFALMSLLEHVDNLEAEIERTDKGHAGRFVQVCNNAKTAVRDMDWLQDYVADIFRGKPRP